MSTNREVDGLLPDWMTFAVEECGRGVIEVAGINANPRILLYLAKTGLKGTKLALSDETAWCSAFACWVMEKAGIKSTRSAAARSWLDWGQPLQLPKPGCITVLERPGAGNPTAAHVAFFFSERLDSNINVLGGNQRNRVCVAPYDKSRVIGYRWPVLA